MQVFSEAHDDDDDEGVGLLSVYPFARW